MRKHIHAFTETGAPSFPGFISLNQEADGRHTVVVRSRGNGGNTLAVITMPPEEMEAMARAILAHRGVEITPPAPALTKAPKRGGKV